MVDAFDVRVAVDVRDFLQELDQKSKRIVTDDLAKLEQPYPGRGKGEKEKIEWRGDGVHRLHVGRTWTAFYDIEDDEDVVTVREVMPIDRAQEEHGDST